MGKEWIKIKEIGQLFLEKILVSFDVPILFVCTDYENRRYLCLNLDDEDGKNIIAETNNKYLLDMLQNKISMDKIFRNSLNKKNIIVEYDYKNKKIISTAVDAEKISAEMLPKENEYFELSNKEIDDYIIFLEKQFIKIENEKFSSNKKFKIHFNKLSIDCNIRNVTAYNCKKMILKDAIKNSSYNLIESMIA